MRICVLLFIAFLFAGLNAPKASSQAQAVSSWELVNFQFKRYGLGVEYEVRDVYYPVEILRSTGARDGISDVAFICMYERLKFRVQVVEGDVYETIVHNMEDMYERSANSRRTFRPKISLNGTDAPKAKWIEGKNDKVVMPMKYETTAQMYNAIARGKEIKFTRKKKTIILNTPKPNADFRAFGDSCLRKKKS